MRKKTVWLMSALAVVAALSGCVSKKNTEAAQTTPAQSLIERMKGLQDKGIMFGHHDDMFYGHAWEGDSGRSDVKEICGDYPAILSTDLAWLETDSVYNIEKIPFDRMRSEIAAHHQRGGITALCWHLHNPLTLDSSWDCDTLHSPFPGIVTEGDSVNLRYREWVGKTADYIMSLKDSEGNSIPVIWRPFHEQNGDWFWWGAQNASPEEYKRLWTIMREIYDEKGVDNVVWAFSPDKCTTSEEYFATYPGDGYVDILGADIYMYGGEKGIEKWTDYIDKEFTAMTEHAEATGQLIAFTETGSESIPVDNWYDGVLLPAISKFPVSFVVAWRNSPVMEHHYYAPFKGHPSEEGFKRFHSDSRTLFLKDISE